MKDFLKRILPYYRPYRNLVLVGLLFVIIANAFQSASPWVLRLAINGLGEDIAKSELWNYAFIIVGVAIGSGFFRFLMRKTLIGVSRHIEFDLRQGIFRHLLTLDPSFYDHAKIGDLMTRSTSDVEQVRMIVGPAMMYTTNTIFGLIFGVTLMIMISPLLTLVVAVVVPLVSVAVYYMGKKIHDISMESQEAFSEISSITQESFSGVRVIKAFGQETNQESKFKWQNDILLNRNIKRVAYQSSFFPSIMMIFGIAIALILLVGGWIIINGGMKVGDFVAFNGYLMFLAWPMVSIGWVVNIFQRGNASLKRIFTLFETKPDLTDPQESVDLPEVHGRIKFDDLTFTYPKANRPALSNISFEIQANSILGIVGRVGSGKSSIVSLLARHYDPDNGAISIEGVPIKKIKKIDLRKNLGVVPQEALLFSTSIEENITLGYPYSQDEIAEAMEISRLVQDVEDFPHGLQTEIGERGVTLSGGQKQRVAIARAVIRKPPIVLLDDALSAVDADTEESILNNLKKYLKDRSSIIVSHRISSVREADEILVLDDGKICERGTHEELLKLGGVYSDIFDREKMSKELEGAI
ncbi:ABC transporter ATP-binding protein/permease [bacterium]|nr:ABC transporter ATP-binding protein/permease [bacterium]